MANLKDDHAYLYKRVRLKVILHILLGIVLVTFPRDANPQRGAVSTVQSYVGNGLQYLGVIYFVLGVLMAFGLYRSRHNYRFVRNAMTVACVYNSLWVLLLMAIFFQRTTRSIAFLTILYGYLAYNMWYVRNDPGWAAIQIVSDYKLEERNGQPASAVK